MRIFLKRLFRWWNQTRLSFLPIRKEIFKYKKDYLLPDLFSGLNVTLVAFPQAMVYALLAGLSIECGLFGVTLSAIAAALFSGSRVLSMGPTNSTAVVMLSALVALGISPDQFPQILPLLLTMTGAFLILGALFNISSLVQYVSKSVISGYMCAVVIIMMVNQIHNALGFDLIWQKDTCITFADTIVATFVGMQNFSGSSLCICLLSILFYYFWRKIFPKGPIIALTVFSLSIVCFFMLKQGISVQVLNSVHASHWGLSLGGFNFDNVRMFAGTAFTLSFICLIDGTTILKTLSARMGKRCNINQMVFGTGWANILCGFFSGMPSSCSLIRSTANYLSGARTAVTSLFCALFCLLGIVILGPFFHYIPKAGLATIIILLGADLFDKHSLSVILKSNRSDAFIFLLTFFSSFIFPLNVSIFLGIFISIALFLKKAATPEFCEYVCEGDKLHPVATDEINPQSEISIIHVEGNLFFGSAEMFRDQIREICKRPQLRVIIIKFRGAFYIDATCLLALEELLRYMHANGRQLILSEVNRHIFKAFHRSGFSDIIGRDNIFEDDFAQTNEPTAKALLHARELIGREDIVVRILTRTATSITKNQFRQKLKSLVSPLKRHFSSIQEKDK